MSLWSSLLEAIGRLCRFRCQKHRQKDETHYVTSNDEFGKTQAYHHRSTEKTLYVQSDWA